MTVIWIAIIAVGLVVLAAAWVVRLDTNRLGCYDQHASRFYDRIQPLVDDDQTPDELLNLVEFMNLRITDTRAANDLMRLLLLINGGHKSAEATKVAEVFSAFFNARPELKQPFGEAMANGLLAITYRDRYFGWYTRRMMAIIRRHENVAPIVVEDFRERSGKDNSCPVPQAA
jgi:hypothetical protein